MKTCLLRHYPVFLLLLLVASVIISFPLQLQALEPYAYAAGIEGYYDFSRLFSLAAGEQFPDFGRYHPNHPIGHALAGVAFDVLGVPALTWMRAINGVAALSVGFFLYLLSLALRLDRFKATLTVAVFYSTHFTALATLSGEWHMPALALNIIGVYRLVFYVENKRPRYLYEATAWMTLGACYHMNASFIMVYLGLMLLVVRPPWKYPIEMLIAALIFIIPILVVYVLAPVFLFKFSSFKEFANLFLVYTKLNPTPYAGLDWMVTALKTFCHGFLFIFPGMQYLTVYMVIFFCLFLLALMGFVRSSMAASFRWLFFILPFAWLFGPRLINSRPDALNGWLFIVPYLSIVIVAGFCSLNERLRIPVAVIAACLFAWNFFHWTLPNASKTSGDIFLLTDAQLTDETAPIGFVVHSPPVSFPEIWYAGSKLNLRKQATFFPCCGEKAYRENVIKWLKEKDRAFLVSDDQFGEIQTLLHENRIPIRRVAERNARWLLGLTPSTVYIPLKNPLRRRKKILIWETGRAN